MTVSAADLRRRRESFNASPEGYYLRLQMSLATLLHRYLTESGVTQRALADAADVHESQLSRILHGEQNCTLSTVSQLLHAIGMPCEIAPTASPSMSAIESGNVGYDDACSTATTGDAASHGDFTERLMDDRDRNDRSQDDLPPEAQDFALAA